jgi:hypothetical protein
MGDDLALPHLSFEGPPRPLPSVVHSFPFGTFASPPVLPRLGVDHATALARLSVPETDEFSRICTDPSVKLNPRRLGFIPSHFWQGRDLTFGELVTDFFQRKNNSNSRFSHKLYNALKISESSPTLAAFVGIGWVSDRILKVDKKAFARLLGIKTIDGSLFHQQGNFPSHGFVEVKSDEAVGKVPKSVLDTVDYDDVRLLTHQPGVFTQQSTEPAIDTCKWISARRRPGQ